MLNGNDSNNSSITNSDLSLQSSSLMNGCNNGNSGNNSNGNNSLSNGIDSTTPVAGTNECKVWKNPCALFRGAEYQRLTQYNGKEPLTFHDMNLSAQEHQTFFSCEVDDGKPEYESKNYNLFFSISVKAQNSFFFLLVMQRAWRERTPSKRIQLAHDALEKNYE